MPGSLKPPNHVGAHAPQPDHRDLHVHKVASFTGGYGESLMNSLERDVRGAAAAHSLVVAEVAALIDAQLREPSLLPGWSVGHVVAHLVHNARSHTRMLSAANTGRTVAQYPGGASQRNDEIEAGALLTAADLTAQLIEANDQLEAAWAAMTPDGWHGTGESFAGTVTVDDLPFRRWRETTLHHTDLGLGYHWSQWPAEYARLELARMTMLWASRQPMGLTTLPPGALALPEHERVAWLVGRAAPQGLEPAGIF